jgi:hypothetical protein
MLVTNTATCLLYFLTGSSLKAQYPSMPMWMPYFLGVGCLVNVGITLALFWWQKWAFYTFCVLAVVTLCLNVFVLGTNPIVSMVGLLGPVVLYAVFQIGGETKGWKYLK